MPEQLHKLVGVSLRPEEMDNFVEITTDEVRNFAKETASPLDSAAVFENCRR
jgi:hypothetical protein